MNTLILVCLEICIKSQIQNIKVENGVNASMLLSQEYSRKEVGFAGALFREKNT